MFHCVGGCDSTQAQVAATVHKHGRVELSHVRCQGHNPGGPHAQGAVAKRSYPTSQARDGGREELLHIRGQGQWPRDVAAWVQEGLEELLHVQGHERWR